MIVSSFRQRTASGVSAMSAKVYPHVIPEHGSAPAVTYSVDDDAEDRLLDGVSSLKTILFSVDCYARDYGVAHELADAVEAAWLNFAGEIGSDSPPDQVDHVRKERRFDLFETDTKLYRVSLQFLVAYY